MELHWEFCSWVPFVSHFCPHDTYRIYKKNNKVRVDASLKGIEGLNWERGKISFIFSPEETNSDVVILDHDNKSIIKAVEFLKFGAGGITAYVDSLLQQNKLLRVTLDLSEVTITPAKTWTGYDKYELVGNLRAQVYSINKLKLIINTRTLKERKEPALGYQLEAEEYFAPRATEAEEGGNGSKGRGMVFPWECLSSRSISLHSPSVSFSSFPLRVHQVLPILQILAPTGKHFEKLEQLLSLESIPKDKFPVKIEIPVMPTITATASFCKYTEEKEIDDELFNTKPEGYTAANPFHT